MTSYFQVGGHDVTGVGWHKKLIIILMNHVGLIHTRRTGEIWCPVVALSVACSVVAGPADQAFKYTTI